MTDMTKDSAAPLCEEPDEYQVWQNGKCVAMSNDRQRMERYAWEIAKDGPIEMKRRSDQFQHRFTPPQEAVIPTEGAGPITNMDLTLARVAHHLTSAPNQAMSVHPDDLRAIYDALTPTRSTSPTTVGLGGQAAKVLSSTGRPT